MLHQNVMVKQIDIDARESVFRGRILQVANLLVKTDKWIYFKNEHIKMECKKRRT